MDLEQIFSLMSGLAVAGWLALALAPLRRDKLVAAARVIAAILALAYVTAKLLPGRAWTQNWLAQQTCRMGRYSLEVFCLGVLLAPLADMVNALAGDAFTVQIFTALVGAALMAALAAWLEFNKRLSQSPRVATT